MSAPGDTTPDPFDVGAATDELLDAVAVLANRRRYDGPQIEGAIASAIDTVLDRARHLSQCRVVAAYPPRPLRGLPGE